jgi:hypothetical protein
MATSTAPPPAAFYGLGYERMEGTAIRGAIPSHIAEEVKESLFAFMVKPPLIIWLS